MIYLVEIKGTMDEMKEIFVGAAIFGAKAELKRQGAKAGKKAVQAGARATVRTARATSKEVKRQNRIMSMALKEANAKLRKKSGELRSGKTQADVMKLAQRIKKRMINKKVKN